MMEQPYKCDEPGCHKLFKRSYHLSRHRKVHSKSQFECTWPGCNQTFARADVRTKHIRRHFARQEKEHAQKIGKIKSFELYTQDSIDNKGNLVKKSISPCESVINETNEQFPLDFPSSSNESDKFSLRYVMNDELEKQQNQGMEELILPDFIDWLIKEDQHPSKYLDYSPTSSFKELLGNTSTFTNSTSQSTISEEVLHEMINWLPSLGDNLYFTIDRIQSYLESFWSFFHVQFPIIHKPTFSTSKTNPLLLLSMISIGASFVSRNFESVEAKANLIRLADDIASPLRYLIYSESENYPSVSTWMIQSLLILECFETTCSNRRLHKRAHLHHGFKIELLKRSPLLGGDPSSTSVQDSMSGESDAWDNWIEFESLKRCAFVGFLFDIYHAIIFGHDNNLIVHHIRLSCPSSNEVWDSSSIDKTEQDLETKKFLVMLVQLLGKQPVITSSLNNGLLLAGIVSLVLQIEQNIPPDRELDWQNLRSSWKTDLLLSLDFWYDNIFDITEHENNYYRSLSISKIHSGQAPHIDCIFPVYHISSAFLRISQYDCIIYAGAPNRMNVKTGRKDLENARKRVKSWANSQNGQVSVVHAYMILFEILLNENGEEILDSYHPNKDPIFYRPNIIASALFLIWSYNFCLYGTESTYLDGSELRPIDVSPDVSGITMPEKLNGYAYLQRIKRSFDKTNSSLSLPASKKFRVFANTLDSIPDKHFTTGLLKLFRKRFEKCNSQICREYGRLLEHCIQRSMGKEQVTCDNMYEDL